MEPEMRIKRESLRVIISEVIMVIIVAIMVVVLAFIVSGYWLNADFTVERQGMLQISSIPTGASVEVDGSAPWFQRTNTSKVLASGEHQISLTKDGYDSWSKTVNISEGLLYRLHYPRLFLQNRTKDTLDTYPTTTFATVSPNHKWLLLASDTTAWSLINLDRDTPTTTAIDISKFFLSVSPTENSTTGLFTGQILAANWAHDNEHVLFAVQTPDGTTEYTLLNIRNITNSLSLTREFPSTEFSKLQIFDNSASRLIAIADGSLYLIDIPSRQISDPLATGLIDFSYYGDEIIFTSQRVVEQLSTTTSTSLTDDASGVATAAEPSLDTPAANQSPIYEISLLKSSDEPTVVVSSPNTLTAYLSEFYDAKYITVIDGPTISVHKKDNFEEVILESTLSFTPQTTTVGHGGEFFFLAADTNFATLDMESLTVTEWTAGTTHYGWLDSDMLYAVTDGILTVYDYDSLNPRQLASNVSSHFPVTITSDKWLYYFSDDTLTREWLIQK